MATCRTFSRDLAGGCFVPDDDPADPMPLRAPALIAKGAPSVVPCFLLARLAVDRDWHGRGLGWGLLRDAMQRVLLLSESIAAPALLVHAREDEARAFYCHHAEFIQSPVDPLHLFLPLKAIASCLRSLGDEAGRGW